MRRISLAGCLAVAVLLALASVGGSASARADASLHAKSICPSKMDICFTLPRVGPSYNTVFFPNEVWAQNDFLKEGTVCTYCATGDARIASEEIYVIESTVAPLGRVWHDMLYRTGPGNRQYALFGGMSICVDGVVSRTTRVRVGPFMARSASCKGRNETGDRSVSSSARILAWRFRDRTYKVILAKSGASIDAKWGKLIASFRPNPDVS